MAELITLAEKVATVGFPALLVLILIGSYYDVWRWSRQAKETESDLRRQIEEAKTDAREWKSAALKGLGILETKTKTEER